MGQFRGCRGAGNMARSRRKLRLKMAAVWLDEVARGSMRLGEYASLCGQLERDAMADEDASVDRAHSDREVASAAGEKQQWLEQKVKQKGRTAHSDTCAAVRSLPDATGAAPMMAAQSRDAPSVAALKTAKMGPDQASDFDKAARTVAAAARICAAPTVAAAESDNCLVYAAAKPRCRQSRPRGRRGYGKRQWRRLQVEASRNAIASAAEI